MSLTFIPVTFVSILIYVRKRFLLLLLVGASSRKNGSLPNTLFIFSLNFSYCNISWIRNGAHALIASVLSTVDSIAFCNPFNCILLSIDQEPFFLLLYQSPNQGTLKRFLPKSSG